MIQTLLRKWAYAISYANSAQRRSAVAPWLRFSQMRNDPMPPSNDKHRSAGFHSSLNNRGRNHTGRDQAEMVNQSTAFPLTGRARRKKRRGCQSDRGQE